MYKRPIRGRTRLENPYCSIPSLGACLRPIENYTKAIRLMTSYGKTDWIGLWALLVFPATVRTCDEISDALWRERRAGCGRQARWSCCSLLTCNPACSSLAPSQRAWGPAAKCSLYALTGPSHAYQVAVPRFHGKKGDGNIVTPRSRLRGPTLRCR